MFYSDKVDMNDMKEHEVHRPKINAVLQDSMLYQYTKFPPMLDTLYLKGVCIIILFFFSSYKRTI